jgi:branched-chain amino acid transport system substrate-binding protein
LKIGYIGWLGLFIGLDTLHVIQTSTDLINQKGDLEIGGKKYTIDLVYYDTNNDQATMTAAANRLIFQDKVKFIVSDGFGIDAVIPITEANKVVLCTSDLSPAILSPNNHYSFMVGFQNTGTSMVVGWLAKNFPGKSVVVALPDNQQGKVTQMVLEPAFKAFSVNSDFETFPATATDLSALGTKVMTLKADLFATVGSSHQAYKAVLQAGFKGQLFNPSTPTVDDLLAELSAQDIEGFIAGAAPTEFDPALTETAKAFKAAWINKFGKWTNPYLSASGNFDSLVTALQKVGNLDTGKVAAALGNGLQFDSPTGPGQLISRPDLGNNRTTDSIQAIYMKKITGGKATLLSTITIDEGLKYFQQVNQSTTNKP